MAVIRDALDAMLTAGGDVLREGFFSSGMDYQRKGAVDLLTRYDVAAEEQICKTLAGFFPDDAVVAEERGGSATDAGRVWIIDTIDGTTNFVHKHPFCCVSIACIENGIPVAGGVYAPVLEQRYIAEKGKGALCNGEPIRVSSVAALSDALLATGFAYERASQKRKIVDLLQRCLNTVQGIRRCGSAALDLCFVAAGIIDIYIEQGIHAWDIAAGSLLVQEAGGQVSGFGEQEQLNLFGREIVATNGLLHEAAMAKIVSGGNA